MAMQVLNRVLIDDAFASLTLDEQFQRAALSPVDKRLAAAIVYMTLENLFRLDFALDRHLKDRSALDKRVVNILRLTACQILLMDRVPDYAAVNEAVSLTRSLGLEDLTGLVNGVLRSLIREMDEIPWPKPGENDYEKVMLSMPEWLSERIKAGYDEETAKAILEYKNADHAVTIRRNEVLLTETEFETLLEKKVWEKKPGRLPGVVKVSGASSIASDVDFQDGRFSIQGEGSMMAALALSPKAGMTVLDCCAAPGGKTCLMAEKMQNTGRVHAWDVHEHRVELIQAQVDRLRLYNVRPAMRDATKHQERFDQTMDAVLIDAPCSGTGVMDNKPDIKYRMSAEAVDALVKVQEQLLNVCSRYIKPGGVLVYATCSLLPEENSQQIERFLDKHPEFALDSLPDTIPEDLAANAGPHGLQLLPHRDQVEGFFIARMLRK